MSENISSPVTILPANDGNFDGSITYKEANRSDPSIFHQMLAEMIGTMILVCVGVNAIHGALLANGAIGNFQVGMVFALGIMWAVYATGMFAMHSLSTQNR